MVITEEKCLLLMGNIARLFTLLTFDFFSSLFRGFAIAQVTHISNQKRSISAVIFVIFETRCETTFKEV